VTDAAIELAPRGATRVNYLFHDGNDASRRVAEKCGFAHDRIVDGGGTKVHVWTRALS
jgi:RimJ/RimL family protein N-acetyltransferase